MKRRDFLKDTGAIVSIALLSQTLIECSKESVTPKTPANFSIDLTESKYSSLTSVGGVVLANNIYIVRANQSSYIALSRICTHAGCSVDFNSSNSRFVCPCHGGVYDISGKVVSGPPPSPLAQYQTSLSGTTLTITS